MDRLGVWGLKYRVYRVEGFGLRVVRLKGLRFPLWRPLYRNHPRCWCGHVLGLGRQEICPLELQGPPRLETQRSGFRVSG